MKTFDPTNYGPVFAELLVVDEPCELGPGTPNRAARAALEAMTPETAFAHAAVVDRQMAALCCAGVWLLHDDLDTSHTISQKVKTTSGSYWHGIMHRREGDYSNAKYWFGNVGHHPVYEPLAEVARVMTTDESATEQGAGGEAAYLADQSAWDAYAFVDLCAAAEQGLAGCEPLCRLVQQREWELLFDSCYRQAAR